MRIARGVSALALVSLIAVACSGGAATPAPTQAPTTGPTTAPATAAPTTEPDACAPDQLALRTAGTLTIGADNPAYPPYYEPSEQNEDPWELGDPTNGEGFEGAVAYALAAEMGFESDQVTWVVTPWSNSFQPGPKDFDIYLSQVSYRPDRAQAVDMSQGYYFVNQSVVAVAGSPIASARTIADLKPYTFAAQVGTTSYSTIVGVIGPDQDPLVFDSNDAAIEALQNGQADAIVVDLPTAFFVTAVQLEDGVIVGQFEAPPGGEYFSVVLDKDSSLTTCVNGALNRMRASGELDAITEEWLADKVSAPVFQP